MRTLLHEVKDISGEVYQLYAQLVDSPHPENTKKLSFYTVWTDVKNPKTEQRKCEFLLSNEAMDNLKKLLESK